MNRSLLAATMIAAFGSAASVADLTMTWFTIDAGGGVVEAGAFRLSSTTGQPDASDALTGDGFRLTGGFWTCTLSPCPADFDGDGFVTGDDFDAYVAAFELGSDAADFDLNGFVTGDDFDAYVASFELGC